MPPGSPAEASGSLIHDMPKRSAWPLTPRKKARSNEPFIQDLPSSFFPLHFILPLHRQPNSVAIAQVNAPHFNARPRPTYECPPPSAPLTSYLIRIRSTLRPPCRSQFTHYFCDFLRRYLFQLRAPSVPLRRTALTSQSLASLRESFFFPDTCSRIFATNTARRVERRKRFKTFVKFYGTGSAAGQTKSRGTRPGTNKCGLASLTKLALT